MSLAQIRKTKIERRILMTKLVPLRKAVVQITNEATLNDDVSVRKAIKAWHNRLATGSIPRKVVKKLGRELFLDLDAWEELWEERSMKTPSQSVGRPRNGN
jgi:hypothetical protein